MAQCEAISNPDSIWPHMCPNLPAAYLFATLFCGTTVAHIVQGIVHRKPYTWVIAFSGALQTAAYILRVLSIYYVDNATFYSNWFSLMMVAPVWTNAYAYMVMGRMVYNFTPTASVFQVRAWRFGLIFVLLDLAAFIVQLGGAAIASVRGDPDLPMLGIHVYMGGIGFQQLCIFVFLALAIRFQGKLRLLPSSDERSTGFHLLCVEYSVLLLITVRIIFRLIEYSNGIESAIPKQEAYQYVFDSTLMLIASALFNIFHPGRLMPGKESDLPDHKLRKNMKKQGQTPSGRIGIDYLLPKYFTDMPSTEDVAQKSPPTMYDAGRGQYTSLGAPSPTLSPPHGKWQGATRQMPQDPTA